MKETKTNILSKTVSIKQELFCQNYVKNDELRWNWTLSYNEAYKIWLHQKSRVRDIDEETKKEIPGTSEYDKSYNRCSIRESQILRLFKIQDRNKELLREMLNHDAVDSVLAKHLHGSNERISLDALKEYNKMHQRIIEKKEIEITGMLSQDQIDKLTPKEADKYLNKMINGDEE